MDRDEWMSGARWVGGSRDSKHHVGAYLGSTRNQSKLKRRRVSRLSAPQGADWICPQHVAHIHRSAASVLSRNWSLLHVATPQMILRRVFSRQLRDSLSSTTRIMQARSARLRVTTGRAEIAQAMAGRAAPVWLLLLLVRRPRSIGERGSRVG